MRLLFALLFIGSFSACRPTCVDNACVCNPGETCSFACSGEGTFKPCSFDCETGSNCSGTLAERAVGTCAGAACTLTVGEGSKINCSTGTCNISCTGKCTIEGSGAVTTTCASGSPTATGCP